jgi:dihydroorotase-like cyclic amidohydrolase
MSTNNNLLRLPGLIDIHVHLREPGQTYKEDFLSGTCAAVAGGFATVVDMPNNVKPIFTRELLLEKKELAQQKTVCRIGFYFGSMGQNLAEFAKVQDEVLGLKLYLNETTGNFLIDKSKLRDIFHAWHCEKPILLHAEDDAVAEVIKIVKETHQKSHFCHISSQKDLEQIMRAKDDGLPITCGVTPHHLFLTEEDAIRLQSYGRMKPPLKPKSDVDFLWKHFDDIDIVESDHAPHTVDEKSHEPAPYGVPGLETTLPLLITAMNEGTVTHDQIIDKCYTQPMKILNLTEESDTHIDVDVKTTFEIRGSAFQSKCKWTPFEGRKVQGTVLKSIIAGHAVYENGTILVEPGSGTVL